MVTRVATLFHCLNFDRKHLFWNKRTCSAQNTCRLTRLWCKDNKQCKNNKQCKDNKWCKGQQAVQGLKRRKDNKHAAQGQEVVKGKEVARGQQAVQGQKRYKVLSLQIKQWISTLEQEVCLAHTSLHCMMVDLTQRPITCTVAYQLTLQYMVSIKAASYCLKQRQHVSILAINKPG